MQSADAIRGAFHAPSELETLLDWIKESETTGERVADCLPGATMLQFRRDSLATCDRASWR